MKPLIVANWKCNPVTLEEAKRLFDSVKRGVAHIKNVEVVICPPFVYLSNLIKNQCRVLINGEGVKLGAQDCFWEEKGAFTGEVSPKMLKGLGCQYVILGHSERRRYLEESDETINKKIKAVLETKLKPIFCIGETERERKLKKTEKIISFQIKNGFKNLAEVGPPPNLIVAYEPVWAIGKGRPCGISDAREVNLFIKKLFNLPVLYGGSVNSENARDYIEKAGFQGLLVGGASLDAGEFVGIVKNVSKA